MSEVKNLPLPTQHEAVDFLANKSAQSVSETACSKDEALLYGKPAVRKAFELLDSLGQPLSREQHGALRTYASQQRNGQGD